MVVSSGQLVNVSQGQQMIVQHINSNKATIATINGQQVLIRPNTGKSINKNYIFRNILNFKFIPLII